MDYQAILKDFGGGKVKPVYFLTGDEDYFIDSLVKEAENNLVPESQKDFNLQVVYGKILPPGLWLNTAGNFLLWGTKNWWWSRRHRI